MFGNKQPTQPKPMPPWLKWGLIAFVAVGFGMRILGITAPAAQKGQNTPQQNAEPHWNMPSMEAYKEQLIPGYGRLQVLDTAAGKGTGAVCGQEVSIRYGEEPIGPVKPGAKKPPAPPMKPLSFRLGSKDAPAVLQESVTGMRPGGKRQTVVPPERSGNGMAYRYIIEMLKAEPAIEPLGKGRLGLRMFDRVTGMSRLVSCGDTASAQITVWDMAGKKLLDTHEKGGPVALELGSGLIMSGLETGIPGMRADGSRTLLIPPALQKPLHSTEKSATKQTGPLADLKLPEDQFIVVDIDLVP